MKSFEGIYKFSPLVVVGVCQDVERSKLHFDTSFDSSGRDEEEESDRNREEMVLMAKDQTEHKCFAEGGSVTKKSRYRSTWCQLPGKGKSLVIKHCFRNRMDSDILHFSRSSRKNISGVTMMLSDAETCWTDKNYFFTSSRLNSDKLISLLSRVVDSIENIQAVTKL